MMISVKTAICGAGVSLIGAATSYTVLVVNGLASPDFVRFIFGGVGAVLGLVCIEVGSCVQRAQDAGTGS